MPNYISKLLLVATVLLPLLLIAGSAFYGVSVPIEGRTISDLEFLEDSENEIEVLFFGYVGCSYICPTSLLKIGKVLDNLNLEQPDAKIGGFFIDVNAETQIRRANEYSLNFSDLIQGINVDQEILNELRSEFGLNVFDTNREIDEIIHTDHFFVLKKEQNSWVVTRVLANETDQKTIKQAIKQEIDQKLLVSGG